MAGVVCLDQKVCFCQRKGGWTLQSGGAVRCKEGSGGDRAVAANCGYKHPKPAHGSRESPGANPQVKSSRKALTQYNYFFLPTTNPARAGERLPAGLSRSPKRTDSLLALTTASRLLL